MGEKYEEKVEVMKGALERVLEEKEMDRVYDTLEDLKPREREPYLKEMLKLNLNISGDELERTVDEMVEISGELKKGEKKDYLETLAKARSEDPVLLASEKKVIHMNFDDYEEYLDDLKDSEEEEEEDFSLWDFSGSIFPFGDFGDINSRVFGNDKKRDGYFIFSCLVKEIEEIDKGGMENEDLQGYYDKNIENNFKDIESQYPFIFNFLELPGSGDRED